MSLPQQFDLLLKIGQRLEVWRVELRVWVKLGAKGGALCGWRGETQVKEVAVLERASRT